MEQAPHLPNKATDNHAIEDCSWTWARLLTTSQAYASDPFAL